MKTKYDWSKIPKEVNWIAIDSSNTCLGFNRRPEKFLDTWIGDSRIHIGRLFCENWQDSLEERPK